MSRIHDQIFASMKQMKEQMGEMGKKLMLPPPSMLTLKHHYIGYTEGVSLTAEVPFNPDFVNPVGYFQGGFLAAAIDDVYGPLSYMSTGGPCVSLDFNIKFIRPFVSEQKLVIIEAVIISKTKSIITMEAKMKSPEGKILAISSMTSMILKN
ncbi:MAG: PaaI family thioesterase [Bacteriovoracaceae bacterium]